MIERRDFLKSAVAGAVGASAVVVGGVEAAGAVPKQAPSAPERGFYNVKDYGAQGNGTADDTAAIRSAIAAAQQNAYGGVVYLPVGQYVVTAPLVITRSDILILAMARLPPWVAPAKTTATAQR